MLLDIRKGRKLLEKLCGTFAHSLFAMVLRHPQGSKADAMTREKKGGSAKRCKEA
jgi:hypothetical protein